MRRLAVGDIQGCLDPLLRLLDRARFDPATDSLWSVGDLVNRGPSSLETLRFFRELGSSARVVLGNHDLHLLAVAAGIRSLKKSDTLQPVLDAPDVDELLAWLRARPLLVHAGGIAMVHAGLAPAWSLAQAQQLSDEIGLLLTGPQQHHFLESMYGDLPDRWDDSLQGPARWRVITNHFTRMRFCRADGSLDLSVKSAPADAPPDLLPWYTVRPRKTADITLVFGHWASLMGNVSDPHLLALDTGCVWGECLTLIDLDSRERWTHACN